MESLAWLERQCDLLRLPSNREPNREVIRALYEFGATRSWTCHKPVPLPLGFRADLGLKVSGDLQVVEGGRPYLVWFQLRRGSTAPSPKELSLLARVFVMAREEAGYEELGLYIVDMREMDGNKRAISLWSLDDLCMTSEAEVTSTLQLFADAYDVLRAEGFDPKVEKKRRAEGRAAAARASGRSPMDDLFRP